MKTTVSLLPVIIFLLLASWCQGQATHEISSPELSVRSGIMTIRYQILNSRPGDLFNIRLEVTDAEGNPVNAVSLSGDVGKKITGGGNKLIRWNYNGDKVDVSQGVYVEIFGELVEKSKGDQVLGAVLRSVAFPGWGLTNVTEHNLHLVKGVAGYAAIAGSVVFNAAAYKNYRNYEDSTDPLERDDLYSSFESQDRASTILAFTAVAVWATDVVWTLVRSERSEKITRGMGGAGISMRSGIDAATGIPLVSFMVSF